MRSSATISQSLRITTSGGEAWTEAPWRWFFDHVCKNRIPIINISGGTEVGGCISHRDNQSSDEPGFVLAQSARHGRGHRRPVGQAPADRRGRRTGVAQRLDRDDEEPVERRRSATSTATGARFPDFGCMAISRWRAMTGSSTSSAARTTPSRFPANAPDLPNSRAS